MRSCRTIALVSLGSLVVGAAAASAIPKKKSRYLDATYRFELAMPPVLAAPEVPVVTVASFFLPPKKDFAPNVNVQVQRGTGGLQAFRELSERQFKSLGYDLRGSVARRVGGNAAWEMSYRATIEGRKLAFLALAVERRGEVFLVTCTAAEGDFAGYEATFREVLAGFSFTKD